MNLKKVLSPEDPGGLVQVMWKLGGKAKERNESLLTSCQSFVLNQQNSYLLCAKCPKLNEDNNLCLQGFNKGACQKQGVPIQPRGCTKEGPSWGHLGKALEGHGRRAKDNPWGFCTSFPATPTPTLQPRGAPSISQPTAFLSTSALFIF